MKRYGGAFGLLGFLGVIAIAGFGEASLTTILWKAILWGIGFAILGTLLGRAAGVLLSEADADSEYQTGGTVAEAGNRSTAQLKRLSKELIVRELEKVPEMSEEPPQIAEKPEEAAEEPEEAAEEPEVTEITEDQI